jgi:hypothetical protein
MKKLKVKFVAFKEAAKNKVLDAVIKRIALKPEDVASEMCPHEVACGIEVSQVAEHVAEMFSAEEIAENINVDDGCIVDAVAEKFDAAEIAECIDIQDLSYSIDLTEVASNLDMEDIKEAVASDMDLEDVAEAAGLQERLDEIKREATKATSTEDILKEIAQRIIQGPIE